MSEFMGYSKLTTAEIYDCTVQTIADVRTYGSTLVVPSVLFLDVTTKFGEYDISFKKLVKFNEVIYRIIDFQLYFV